MITIQDLELDIFNSRMRKFSWVFDELELQDPEVAAEIDFLIEHNKLLEKISL